MEALVAKYKKAVRGICFFFEVIAALSLVGMLLVVLYNVIMRYWFNSAPGWGEEIARQLMIFFVFIGIAIGVRDKLHISLTVVVERLLSKYTLPIEIMNKFLTFFLGIMMSVFMGPYFVTLKYNKLPGSGIPVGYIYLLPTIMGILISLMALYQIYDHFKHGTDDEQKELAKKKEGN